MIITEEHIKILPFISSESCWRYRFIEEKIGIPVKRLKELMLELKIAGYVYWGNCVDGDFMWSGSGHFATDKGEDLKRKHKIETFNLPDYD